MDKHAQTEIEYESFYHEPLMAKVFFMQTCDCIKNSSRHPPGTNTVSCVRPALLLAEVPGYWMDHVRWSCTALALVTIMFRVVAYLIANFLHYQVISENFPPSTVQQVEECIDDAVTGVE